MTAVMQKTKYNVAHKPPYKLMSRVNEPFGAVAHNLVLRSVATFIYTEL